MGRTFDLREKSKDIAGESKVDGSILLIPNEMNAVKVGDPRENSLC